MLVDPAELKLEVGQANSRCPDEQHSRPFVCLAAGAFIRYLLAGKAFIPSSSAGLHSSSRRTRNGILPPCDQLLCHWPGNQQGSARRQW